MVRETDRSLNILTRLRLCVAGSMSTNTVLRRLVQPRLLILAMILRPSSDHVTRKHCIKPPTIDAIVMNEEASPTCSRRWKDPKCSAIVPQWHLPDPRQPRNSAGRSKAGSKLNAYD
jgi:hypothetical protein